MNKEWLRRTIRSFEPYVVPEIKERTVINATPTKVLIIYLIFLK